MKLRFLLFLTLSIFMSVNTLAQDNGTTYVWLRFGHFSVDSPDIDVYIDNQLVLENVSYKTVTTYFPIEQGEHTIAFVNSDEESNQAIISPVTLPFAADETYLLGIAGHSADGSLQLAAIQESVTLRAVQRSNPNMGELNELAGFIFLHGLNNGPELAIITQTGETVTTGINFTNLYISPVIPGRYPILITTAEAQNVVIFNELNPFTFSPGVTYLVVVGGTRANPELIVVTSGTQKLETLILQSPEISGFARLSQIAGQLNTLGDTTPYTFFIPTNDVLADAQIDLNTMLNDPSALKALLDYHTIEGDFTLEALNTRETLNTVSGDAINVSRTEDGESILLNNRVTVNPISIQGLNGRIYLIDGVLQSDDSV